MFKISTSWERKRDFSLFVSSAEKSTVSSAFIQFAKMAYYTNKGGFNILEHRKVILEI